MPKNIIEKKSFDFAISIIKLCRKNDCDYGEYVILKQLLRSGTSIGANVKEGLRGQSKRDFLTKMNIALKEANESEYWIELLIGSGYFNIPENNILIMCKELCRILSSIVYTTKRNLNN